jgi:D-sedoheptulose 7-phosphate isomerase
MKAHTWELFERELRAGRLEPLQGALEGAFDLLAGTFRAGGKVLVCGNGGSAADSEHIVGELMKGFRSRRELPAADRERLAAAWGEEGRALAGRLQRALPAISLVSQVSLGTAVANDLGAELVFAQQVYGYGRPGDLLLAISTSGNAANVLAACRTARAFGLRVLGFSGQDGGRLSGLCDLCLRPPASETSEVQVWHLRAYHLLCAALEQELLGPAAGEGAVRSPG